MDRRFDWWMVFGSSWMVFGLYLDGWAHRHLHDLDDLDTFFTAWHGVLYSGFLACAALLTWHRFRRSGPAWDRSRDGYRISFIGVVVFALGGVGDLVWHTLLGVEVDLDALLSPTHLTLAAGGVLIVSGPFRAEWHRERQGPLRLVHAVPMLVSLTLVLSVFTFFTQFAHPLVSLWPAGGPPDHPYFSQALGVASILLQAALLTGAILLMVSRWELPFGSLTVIMTLNAALLGMLDHHADLGFVGLVAGLVSDGLARVLKPSTRSGPALRAFAALVPAMFYAVYFGTLAAAAGVWWSVPMWTGSIVLAGAVGWMVSLLVLPLRRGSS